MGTFAEAKQEFDKKYKSVSTIKKSIVPVDGKIVSDIKLRNSSNGLLEEYYKWQFVHALIESGLYPKDYIGVEVRFPKGNKTSAPIKLDGAIFDDADWLDYYTKYWQTAEASCLEWLNEHLLCTIEFKHGDKEIERVFAGQIKPAMNQKDPSNEFVLGIYYDAERLFVFQRKQGCVIRFDEGKNQKAQLSKVGDLMLHLPDPYAFIPSLVELRDHIAKPKTYDRSKRSVSDLDVITSIRTVQIQTALSQVLRALDKGGLVNQRGYQILIEALALKIFDEKRNAGNASKHLKFYVLDDERDFLKLTETGIQNFIKRMKQIWTDAESQYERILSSKAITWTNQNHVQAVISVCAAFQDLSFIRSTKSDLYQLVFYNFANSFKRDDAGQFLTPLPVIDFLVSVVNPRDGETVFDPCCGIADFLSMAFVNSRDKKKPMHLNDANLYGVDLDESMIMLATLNMLLNGDGEAKLFQKPDKGSILSKVAKGNPPKLVDLQPKFHAGGNWDNWPDGTQLMKFDVILTNPPFGDDRGFRPQTSSDKSLIQCYETWSLKEGLDYIDLGIVFLENAVHVLKEEGRLGIVLSNSIASISRWEEIRKWLLSQLRIVALFDLPPNVFAETGVNTTLLVGYKPTAKQKPKLLKQGYRIFIREIKSVGYERRTRKRNVFFDQRFKISEETFEIQLDATGSPVIDEDFSSTVADFRKWALSQEETVQRIFLDE